MGRRSINTTKSGKFMNPTDQFRKEARKKELKKNKKQRLMVRTAVLKGKDAMTLLHEMEEIDKMEFDPVNPPSLSEKVLKDKRRKLMETFDRVVLLYEREDVDYCAELRAARQEYENRRTELMIYFEQVKNAERVQVDQIPLPDMPSMPSTQPSMIPLPSGDFPNLGITEPMRGILKHARAELATRPPPGKIGKPPGPPPGNPPELSDSDDDDDDDYDSRYVDADVAPPGEPEEKKRRIRFADEDATKVLPPGPPPGLPPNLIRPPPLMRPPIAPPGAPLAGSAVAAAASAAALAGGTALAGVVRALPPGPPPGRPPGVPPGPPPGLPPHLRAVQQRLAPPGVIPPRLIRPPTAPPGIPPPGVPPQAGVPNPNMIMAPPAIKKLKMGKEMLEKKKDGATIEAKPQIKNPMGDVTRFMPTALKVKREVRDSKGRVITKAMDEDRPIRHPPSIIHHNVPPAQTKDDAYDDFMKELQGLM